MRRAPEGARLFRWPWLHREGWLVGRVGKSGTVQAEGLDRILRLPVERELAEDLAHKARELEAVTRPDEDGDLGVLRQSTEHELAVRRHVVEAGLGVELRPQGAFNAS